MTSHQAPRELTVTIHEALTLALDHHQNGRLAQAETIYRKILVVEPSHPDSLDLLGVIAHQVGRNDHAIDLIGKAIAHNSQVSHFHNNIGEAFRASGRFDEAITSYTEALRLKPDDWPNNPRMETGKPTPGHLIVASAAPVSPRD